MRDRLVPPTPLAGRMRIAPGLSGLLGASGPVGQSAYAFFANSGITLGPGDTVLGWQGGGLAPIELTPVSTAPVLADGAVEFTAASRLGYDLQNPLDLPGGFSAWLLMRVPDPAALTGSRRAFRLLNSASASQLQVVFPNAAGQVLMNAGGTNVVASGLTDQELGEFAVWGFEWNAYNDTARITRNGVVVSAAPTGTVGPIIDYARVEVGVGSTIHVAGGLMYVEPRTIDQASIISALQQSSFAASFAPQAVAHDAGVTALGTITTAGNIGPVEIVGGPITDQPGDNGGTFTVPDNLSVTFDATALAAALADGAQLTTSITLQLRDGLGQTIDLPIEVTVSRIDDAPVAAGGLADLVLTQGVAMAPVDVSGDFTDVGDTLSFTASGLPAGLTLSTAGLLSGTPTSLVTGQPAVVTAMDAGGQTAQSGFQITVEASGSAPTVNSDLPKVTAIVGQPMTPIDALSVTTGATGATRFAPAVIPPGTSYSALGVLTGTPTERGAWVISQRATGPGGSSRLYSYVLEATPAIDETIRENPVLSYNAGEHNYFSPEDAFINKAKMGSPWSGQRPALPELTYGDLLAAGVINASGYPTGVGATGVSEFNTYFAWGDFLFGPAMAGDYVVKWDALSGAGGTVRLTEAAAGYVSAGTRRLTFTYSGTGNWGLFFDPAGATAGYPTNIRICRAEHEDLLDDGAIWNPAFLAIMHNVREYRFLDWMHANNSTWSDYAADRTLPEAYTYGEGNGGEVTVPVEIMCDLCNKTTTEPWFTIPHLFTDASITAFATAVRDNLDPSLRARFEWSNEVWNDGFAQRAYALAQSNAAWGPGTNDAVGWQTKRAVQMAQLIDAVYAGQTSRRVNVLGVNQGAPFYTGQMLTAAGWFANEPGANIPANQPTTVFQEVAITTYFGAAEDIIKPALSAAIAAGFETGAEFLYADLLNPALESSVPFVLDLIDQHLTQIAGGGPRLTFYEGGQHFHFENSITSTANDAFFLQFAQSDYCMDLYQRVFEGLEARGVGPFMQFNAIGNSGQYGTWGLRQSLTDTTSRRIEYVLSAARQKAQWWTDARPVGTFTGGAAVPSTVVGHFHGHSMMSHDQVDRQAPVWVHRMAEADGLGFRFGGVFIDSDAQFLAPPGTGHHVYNGTIANDYEAGGIETWAAFEAAGVHYFGMMPNNFADDQAAEDQFVNRANDMIQTALANMTTPPVFALYLPVDANFWYIALGSGTAYPGTEADFVSWRNAERTQLNTIWANAESRIRADNPDADIIVIDTNRIVKRTLKNTPLEPLRMTDVWRFDDSVHGEAIMYLLKAMVMYGVMYNRPCPVDFDLAGANLPAEFTDHIPEIRDYVYAETVAAAQVPPGGFAPAPDVTAPVLTNATDAANGATASTGGVDTDEGNGTLFAVVTQSATPPSDGQIQAGQDHLGAAADWDGSQAVSASGTQTLTPAPSGLAPSTAYWTHYVHVDANANVSNVVSASGFTTAAAATVPGAPTDLFVIGDDTIADLDWTAPASDGGSAIIGYQIERNIDGGGWSVLVPDTGTTAVTYQDTLLTNDLLHQYRVSAINLVGTGAASNVDGDTPAAAPSFDPAGGEAFFEINRSAVGTPITGLTPAATVDTVAGTLENLGTGVNDFAPVADANRGTLRAGHIEMTDATAATGSHYIYERTGVPVAGTVVMGWQPGGAVPSNFRRLMSVLGNDAGDHDFYQPGMYAIQWNPTPGAWEVASNEASLFTWTPPAGWETAGRVITFQFRTDGTGSCELFYEGASVGSSSATGPVSSPTTGWRIGFLGRENEGSPGGNLHAAYFTPSILGTTDREDVENYIAALL